ncbi:MAG TPA: hypothetical protein VIQ81_00290 [Gammaproteobacteria bacterium]
MNYADEAIKLIDYLNSKGKNPDSLSEAFPYIHHFKKSGGDSSLEGFYQYCKKRKNDFGGNTNINVVKRLQVIKEKTDAFLKENPGTTISSMKFQKYAVEASNEIPIN